MRKHPVTLLILSSVILAAALVSPGATLADSAPIPTDGSLPWTDPNHQNPLELRAGQIASQIAGRPVGARCEGDTDWATLSHENGADSYGFVRVQYWHWNGTTWNPVTEDFEQLSPYVCSALQRFAQAAKADEVHERRYPHAGGKPEGARH